MDLSIHTGQPAEPVDEACGGFAFPLPPVAVPRWPGLRCVDLVARSVEAACRDDETLFLLLAKVLDVHLRTGFTADAAAVAATLDDVLSAISPALHRQVAALGGEGAPIGRPVAPRAR